MKPKECPECGEICQLGRYIAHDDFDMLSIEQDGEFILVGTHFSNSEFGNCSSIRVVKKQLLKIIS